MLHLYFRKPKRKPRWLPGDQHLRNLAASAIELVRPRPVGGVERVFLNLCKGLDQVRVPYLVNQPFNKIKPADSVGVLGLGRSSLSGYNQDNEIVAGIALMTHPSEWPDLCDRYPIRAYLQHSEWAANLYRPYFGEKVGLWAAGIDTEQWKPLDNASHPEFDILLYNKVHWNIDQQERELVQPIRNIIRSSGASFVELKPGSYRTHEYLNLLRSCRAMLFLSEHESQGLACQEAMATGLPILAWDQGFCLDPVYAELERGSPVRATSVPYFDERCGLRFSDSDDFGNKFPKFLRAVRSGEYTPRAYILEHLTLESSAMHFLNFFSG